MSDNTESADAADRAIFEEWASMQEAEAKERDAKWEAMKSFISGPIRRTGVYKQQASHYDPESKQFLGNTKDMEVDLGQAGVALLLDGNNVAETRPEIVNYVPDATESVDEKNHLKTNGKGETEAEVEEEKEEEEEEAKDEGADEEAVEDTSWELTKWEEPKGDETKDEETGKKCEVKKLYAGQHRLCECCIKWEDDKPDTGNEGVKEERDRYAILYRLIPHGGDDEWKTHSISVNSPRLRQCLATVFEDYPGFDPDDVTFKHPFALFLHRWDRLLELQQAETDAETQDHIILLRQLLEHELKEPFAAMKKFAETGLISFDNMIYALVPGEIITGSRDGEPCAALLRRVEKVQGRDQGPEYRYYVEVVDTDGERFGVVSTMWGLRYWSGTKQMASLEHFPLRVYPERDDFIARLIERGRKFEKLHGQHYKAYRGKGVFQNERDEARTKLVRLFAEGCSCVETC
jgi:hypothetical protein